MKERLYDIMCELNDVLKDIDSIIRILEIEFDGVVEVYDTDTTRSVLRVHLRLLRGIQEDCNKIYNRIDETILDIRHERI